MADLHDIVNARERKMLEAGSGMTRDQRIGASLACTILEPHFASQAAEVSRLRALLRDSAGLHEAAASFTQMSQHPLAGRCTVALRNIKSRIDAALAGEQNTQEKQS